MQIQLTDVRLSFPNIFEAKAFAQEDPKFGATFLIDKATQADQIAALRKVVMDVINAKWPKGVKLEADKICVKDSTKNPKEYDGYENVIYIHATNADQPGAVDRDAKPITDRRKLYGGCFVNAYIDIWAQDNKWGKRVNATLIGVQFSKDGQSFGGAVPFNPNVFSALAPLAYDPNAAPSPNADSAFYDDPADAPAQLGNVDDLPF